jgi:hypothetical protein
MNRPAPAVILVISSLLPLPVISGCVRASANRGLVRPAAHQEKFDEPAARPLQLPFALATPEDAIVRVVTPGASCTGTLVDEDLVLTAHHCIVKRNEASELTQTHHRIDDIGIELGGDDLAWGRVGVKHIVTPPCGQRGGSGDVAVLVLERKLVGVARMRVRLDAPPNVVPTTVEAEGMVPLAASTTDPNAKPGARTLTVVDPIGFGRCALTSGGVHRRPRLGGPIEAVARGTFRLRASVCPGDSGGPVLVRGTNEVVGVMSMSAMDGDDRTAGLTIAARIDAVRPVFAQARAIADGASPAELPPISCP